MKKLEEKMKARSRLVKYLHTKNGTFGKLGKYTPDMTKQSLSQFARTWNLRPSNACDICNKKNARYRLEFRENLCEKCNDEIKQYIEAVDNTA